MAAKCQATVQGDRDPDLLRLARDGQAQNARAVALQPIASLQATVNSGDATGAFLESGHPQRSEGALHLRQPKSGCYGLRAEQVLEIAHLYGICLMEKLSVVGG